MAYPKWEIHLIGSHEYIELQCAQCSIYFSLPLYTAQQCWTQGKTKTFYCPNGHAQIYDRPREKNEPEEKKQESIFMGKEPPSA